MSKKEDVQPEMTPEQVKEMRQKMVNYYKEQIPLLKNQLEYEKLLADIEEARTKNVAMVVRRAEMLAGPLEEPEEPVTPPTPPTQESKERKLQTK